MGAGESKLEKDDDHESFTDFCCYEKRKRDRGDQETARACRTHFTGEDRLAQRLWDSET